jgi:2-amino-4-hydroxy-6-hydroxymethyldihydropteridine diphosphokinase
VNKAYLLLGSNIEPRTEYIEKAEMNIIRAVGKIIRKSEVYESGPWGFEAETLFLNRVLEVSTNLSPEMVLQNILAIEQEMGRERSPGTYTSRNIDIDILYFNNQVVENKFLSIPHPRLHQRRFTLLPLSEIAPGYIHPVLKMSNNELLDKCEDRSTVLKYKSENR